MIFLSINEQVNRAKVSPKAFEQLYLEYMPNIYSFIASRTSCTQEAEDLTSDIWFKILQKLDTFNPKYENSFLAWIFIIARHQLTDYYRKNNKGQSKIIALNNVSENTFTDDFDVINEIDNKLVEKKLKNILMKLPPKQRESVSLKYFGGLKNKEIALIQGTSEKTVASNLVRALIKIKSAYTVQ